MALVYPFLWFDKEALEAAEFYASVFPDCKIIGSSIIKSAPDGPAQMVYLEIADQRLDFISAGPVFKLNSSSSFILNFSTDLFSNPSESLESLWRSLTLEGEVFIPLGAYEHSSLFDWVKDKYGINWQLNLLDNPISQRPFLMPCLMFDGNAHGHAKEAMNLYLSTFSNHEEGTYLANPIDNTSLYCDFRIQDLWICLMDAKILSDTNFNEAFSFIVICETQEEIDYYHDNLSHYHESEICGWLKDPYGVSWQITPKIFYEMYETGSKEQLARLENAFMGMKRLNISELLLAFNG